MERNARRRFGAAKLACALLTTVSPVAVCAQEKPAGMVESPSGDDIIVTAQRREERLQDVPIAVSALNAAQIERSNARDIQGIQKISPNLIVDPVLGNGTAAISIRGIQFNDVEKSFDPAVAVYLDGIYLANTTGALLQIWDANSIEVLRGPQGTLFGRNTIGGLLQISRTKPLGKWAGKAEFTAGSYGQLDAKGMLNFPAILNDTIATKLSFVRQSGGGYFRNIVRNKREGDADFFGATGTVLWTPSPSVKLFLTYDYINDNTATRPVTALTGPSELFALFGGLGAPSSDWNYHRHTRTAQAQPASVRTDAVTAQLDWNMGEGQDLTTLVGWRKTRETAVQDFDGVQAVLFESSRPQHNSQFSVETRLASRWSPALKTVIGGMYWSSDYALHQKVQIPPLFGDPQNPAVNPLGIVDTGLDHDQDVTSYALFGQADWNITDRLALSLGGRWLRESKRACGVQSLDTATLGRIGTAAFGDCRGAVVSSSIYQPTYTDPTTGTLRRQLGRARWNAFTPRAGVSYKFDSDRMVYLAYTQGFRSGGFNGRATSALSLGPYNPERVDSLELGLKSSWFDRRLILNASAFSTKYKNKQEEVVLPDPLTGTVTVVQNASTATIRGLELELTAKPLPGLTLTANAGYLHARYDRYLVPDPVTPGRLVDLSGLKLRRAPAFNYTLGANWRTNIGGAREFSFDASYSYKDDYEITANNVAAGHVRGFGLLDASATLSDDHWSISLWAKNLTNQHYFQQVLDAGSNLVATSAIDPSPVLVPGLFTYGTIAPPRTGGVTVQLRF